jgi:hypothetical protein
MAVEPGAEVASVELAQTQHVRLGSTKERHGETEQLEAWAAEKSILTLQLRHSFLNYAAFVHAMAPAHKVPH